MVSQGCFSFWCMLLAGSIGGTIGSVLSYGLGKYGGRPFFVKYGKYFFLREHELKVSERWFQKYGDTIAFTSRLLPVVRTFISFPAGMYRIRFSTFTLYTFLGSLIWSLLLVWLGVLTGDNWGVIRLYIEPISYVVAALLVVGIVWYVWHRTEKLKNQ